MSDLEREKWTNQFMEAALKLAEGGSSVLASVIHAPGSGAQVALPAGIADTDRGWLDRLAELHEEWRLAALAVTRAPTVNPTEE